MAASEEQGANAPRNLLSLFPKIGLKIPFLNRNPRADANVEESKPETVVAGISGDGEDEKPIVARVSFPYAPPKVQEPLDVESEAGAGWTSNPVVLWQVYALGGFLILRWVWGRWKERRERGGKKESSDDDQIPTADEDDFHDCS